MSQKVGLNMVNEHYLAPSQIAYTFDGINLFDLRRAQLQRIGAVLGVPHGSKNDLLKGICARADQLGLEGELSISLTDRSEPKAQDEEPKPKKKKKKAKKKAR